MYQKMFSTLLLLLFGLSVYSQQPQTNQTAPNNSEWLRIRSDNSEFSAEFPAKYNYFSDKDGVWISRQSNGYLLKEMRMISGYHENTLISIESYEASKSALETILDNDHDSFEESVKSSFKRNNAKVLQLVTKTGDFYCVRQYFYSKNNIYVLIAASRKGETEAMKRFFDSVIFDTKTPQTTDDKSIAFSALKQTPINLITKNMDKKKDTNTVLSNKPRQTDDKISKLIIVGKPRPSYTDSARYGGVQGTVQVKVKFDENGYIPEIDILKSLPNGLLRQVVFAVVRMKFLPVEEDGKPKAVIKTVMYSFAIY